MRIGQLEIIAEMEEHMRKLGGEFGDWCVGAAKDCEGPFFRRHLVADRGDGLIYREAYTTYAATEVIERLQGCGLGPDGGRR
jgi:hypothetical protein